VVAVEHEARYLVDAELRGQVPGPVLGAAAPVLIDVYLAVAVQVLEGQAFLGKDLNS